MDMDRLRTALGTNRAWQERSDGWWLEDPGLDVETMAGTMRAASARLSTMTAIPDAGQECRVAYHWDIDGILLTVVTMTHAQKVASIASICPAADWVEREIHDYFAITFTGRAELPPLVLRESDPPGVWRWQRGGGGAR